MLNLAILNFRPSILKPVILVMALMTGTLTGSAIAAPGEPSIGHDQPAVSQPIASPELLSNTGIPVRKTPPPEVQRLLLQRASKEMRIPVNQLKIVESKPATFNGCMGIYYPDRACIEIAIFGWKSIVKSPQQTWVYHLNSQGGQITRNLTASGARSPVQVSFNPYADNGGLANPQVVFQSVVAGNLIGSMTTIRLTTDRKITRFMTGPTIKARPIVLKTLTPQQFKTFTETLDRQQFPNLDGLSYLTAASFADYPTTLYQTQSSRTQFVDSETKKLPRSLQTIIREWNRLTTL